MIPPHCIMALHNVIALVPPRTPKAYTSTPPATSNVWGSQFLHIITNSYYLCLCLFVCLFNIVKPVDMKQYLIVTLICIALVTNDVEQSTFALPGYRF